MSTDGGDMKNMDFANPQHSIPLVSIKRLRLTISGAVQGVGFRPLVYRLARKLGINGMTMNTSQGVVIEIEGHSKQLNEFIRRLRIDKPPLAYIHNIACTYLRVKGYRKFTIRQSDNTGGKLANVVADIGTCPDCLNEIFNPNNRRFRYPFTNCTNCGPRYSIVNALPYDRHNTTMRQFIMCEKCKKEYHSHHNRRFHAQPNACPDCGPHLELWDRKGKCLSRHDKSLVNAGRAILNGRIVGLKGLGGFQLLADARNDTVVRLLRKLKNRPRKPFALMYPHPDAISQHCLMSKMERGVLSSSRHPIVILRKQPDVDEYISPMVAPSNPYLGIMLPYTPLHHLLMAELNIPIVATSGNICDEPICIDEREALHRLGNIADLFLVHNGPIARHMDDSVVSVIMNRETVLCSARGYSPTIIPTPKKIPAILAVGGHLKNTIAIGVDKNILISQHIGDLETKQARQTYAKTVNSLSKLYDFKPVSVIADLHPDYYSTKFAEKLSLPLIRVQHHHAHILSCLAENQLDPPALGISWDGTGMGYDGTIWGGEFLKIFKKRFIRVAHFRPFPLPGGDSAIEEPRRTAVGLLYEIFGPRLFKMKDLKPVEAYNDRDLKDIEKLLKDRVNSPLTSSAGRLFDAVSSIIGLCQKTTYDGEAAIQLEYAVGDLSTKETYRFDVTFNYYPYIIDWEPVICAILHDFRKAVPINIIAGKFHRALTKLIVNIARHVNDKNVVLSGGCFQNRILLEKTVAALKTGDFVPYWHCRIPTNDGGLSVGQIMAGIMMNGRN